jgi:hypothetical protein
MQQQQQGSGALETQLSSSKLFGFFKEIFIDKAKNLCILYM